MITKYLSRAIAVLFFTFSACATAVSCKTVPSEIPNDLTAAQLIQRGQDELANARYKSADAYYIAAIDRYGSDLKCYVEARYELAHSFYKQKRYEEAKIMFNEIISIFDSPDAAYRLQPKYKKLAQIQLEQIAEAEAKKAKKSKKAKK